MKEANSEMNGKCTGDALMRGSEIKVINDLCDL